MKTQIFKGAVAATVISHYALVAALAASIPMLAAYTPWYVSIPVVVWILNLFTLPVRCPLTLLENYFREKAGLTKIRGFVSRWLLFRER